MPPLAHLNFHLVIMAEWYMSNMLLMKSPEFALWKDRCCQGLLSLSAGHVTFMMCCSAFSVIPWSVNIRRITWLFQIAVHNFPAECWECVAHPLFCLDLVSSDFNFCGSLKEQFEAEHFWQGNHIKTEVHQWVGPLFLLVMDIYAEVIRMNVTQTFNVIKHPTYLYVFECVWRLFVKESASQYTV